jgi:hypothetical protein
MDGKGRAKIMQARLIAGFVMACEKESLLGRFRLKSPRFVAQANRRVFVVVAGLSVRRSEAATVLVS